MLLYEAPGSPYAQKIKIALREKSIPFQMELPASLGTGRTDDPFGTGNPRAEVPLLVDGETRIFDSTIILEYIEERWPDPPLLPRTPQGRAEARMKGYVGESCPECANFTLVRNGTCLKCDTCGSTTGCS